MRVADQLATTFDIATSGTDTAKKLAMNIKKKLKYNHLVLWTNKPQHGYLFRSRQSVNLINEEHTNAWMKKSTFSWPKKIILGSNIYSINCIQQ